jgi:hypothetical protein
VRVPTVTLQIGARYRSFSIWDPAAGDTVEFGFDQFTHFNFTILRILPPLTGAQRLSKHTAQGEMYHRSNSNAAPILRHHREETTMPNRSESPRSDRAARCAACDATSSAGRDQTCHARAS